MKKLFILFLVIVFINTSTYAIDTFIDKSINLNLEVNQSKTYFPTTAAGIDSYSPSGITVQVQTSTGFINPSITDKIVKVTTGKESGGTFRNTLHIKAVGIGECRIVYSCTYTVPLGHNIGIANIIYHVKVTEETVLVSKISLNRQSMNLPIGNSETLYANIQPTNASNKKLRWTSSNTNIASVTSDGLVTALSNGEAIIAANSTDGSNVTATCNVNVITQVTSIILSKEYLSLQIGQSTKISAIVLPTNATNQELQWLSSDPNIASVDNNGNISANSPGECIILATSTDGSNITSKCNVLVNNIVLVSDIDLNETELTLSEGQSTQIIATISPDIASNKTILWSSSNENIAKITQDGTITAVSNGTAVITAKSTDGSNISASCTVNVVKLVSSIYISNTDLNLNVGEKFTIIAYALPSDATNKILLWNSENENIAKVENGIVSAIDTGHTYITIESTDGSCIKETCKINVDESTAISNISANDVKANDVKANVSNGIIYISNVASNQLVNVFHIDGTTVYKKLSSGKLLSFRPHKKGIYIVKVGAYTFKVMVI